MGGSDEYLDDVEVALEAGVVERGVAIFVLGVHFVVVEVLDLSDEFGFVVKDSVMKNVVPRVLIFLSYREELLFVDHLQKVDALILDDLCEEGELVDVQLLIFCFLQGCCPRWKAHGASWLTRCPVNCICIRGRQNRFL